MRFHLKTPLLFILKVVGFASLHYFVVIHKSLFIPGKALLAIGGDELKKAISELHSSHGDLQTASGMKCIKMHEVLTHSFLIHPFSAP